MSILGVNGALAGAYQYANRTQKTSTNRTGFTEQLQKTGEAAETSKVDAYQNIWNRNMALLWFGVLEVTKRAWTHWEQEHME